MSRSSPPLITLIADTREQEPFSFDSRLVMVERRALPAGDYSVAGMEGVVAVERKTLDDFVSTVIHQRARFRRELLKLAGFRAACVVVEAGLLEVLQGRYRGGAHPRRFGACKPEWFVFPAGKGHGQMVPSCSALMANSHSALDIWRLAFKKGFFPGGTQQSTPPNGRSYSGSRG